MRMLAALIIFAAGIAAAQSLGGVEGDWIGTLDANAMRLRLGIHISRTAAGEYVTTLDSLDQGATGLPVRKTTFANGKLRLEMPDLNAIFEGEVDRDSIYIRGTFTQSAAIPMVFIRADVATVRSRPQTPREPFPYTAEEAYYRAGVVRFTGTLTIPKGEGPFPAVLLISGSGPQDRDSSLFGHKPFLVIADYLSRRGVAVLRVDDRGVGGSSGSSPQASLQDLAGDVLTGIAWLKTQQRIDAARIGVIGHSEGALVGALAASKSRDIGFVVLLASPGVTGEELLYRQAELVARSGGAKDQAIAQNRALQAMIFDTLRAEPNPQSARTRLAAQWEKLKGTMPEETRRQMAVGDAAILREFDRVLSPEMLSAVFYEPAGALKKLQVPVLALNGARDIQVEAAQNLPPIREALAANKDATVSELPGLNHLFQKCASCNLGEYGDIEETFSPAALDLIGAWIAKRTAAPKK
jgi:uncharacterized protein